MLIAAGHSGLASAIHKYVGSIHRARRLAGIPSPGRREPDEIQHWDEYDYVVINNDVERSIASLRAILAAERLRASRLTGLKDFVQNLLAEL